MRLLRQACLTAGNLFETLRTLIALPLETVENRFRSYSAAERPAKRLPSP